MGPIVKAVTESILDSDRAIDHTWRCNLPNDIGDAHYANTTFTHHPGAVKYLEEDL